MTRTVAVVGASLAGLSAGRALRDQGFDGRVLHRVSVADGVLVVWPGEAADGAA